MLQAQIDILPHSIIFATSDFLRDLMCYFVHLYVKLYTSKNYKNLIL